MNQPPLQAQRPMKEDPSAWSAFWEGQNQPWRTEPEIDGTSKQRLHEYLAQKTGQPPFDGISLKRAEVEWLLEPYKDKYDSVGQSNVQQLGESGLDLRGAILKKIALNDLPLKGANLQGARLAEAKLQRAHLEGANLTETDLKGADLESAHLQRAILKRAHLEGAKLRYAHLEEADLGEAHLEQANLTAAYLNGSDLRGAFFDSATNLEKIYLGDKKSGFASLAGIHWNDADLSIVNWGQVKILGDEQKAHQAKEDTRLGAYRTAIRANRQLAVALQEQGLTEDAANFAYRAQVLQRGVLRLQRKRSRYLFSGFLDILAGYGYKPQNSLFWYFAVVIGWGCGYFFVTHFLHAQLYPLAWYEALILSISSFHGRGFFQPVQSLGDPIAILAAFEAIFGLVIEISFIATFTQRFFGK